VERNIQRMNVQSDPVLLAKVLEELMANAVRHTPDNGKITVSATENGGMAELVIENPGSGMTAEDLLTVFQRGTVTQGEVPARPGMGLFLVRSYCHLLGHTIELRAEPDKATRVVLRMKRTPEAAETTGSVDATEPVEKAPETEN
jgi:signal transduction histidine kinase